jgi:hypothetical protein
MSDTENTLHPPDTQDTAASEEEANAIVKRMVSGQLPFYEREMTIKTDQADGNGIERTMILYHPGHRPLPTGEQVSIVERELAESSVTSNCVPHYSECNPSRPRDHRS